MKNSNLPPQVESIVDLRSLRHGSFSASCQAYWATKAARSGPVSVIAWAATGAIDASLAVAVVPSSSIPFLNSTPTFMEIVSIPAGGS
jgi:hypothetical protein